MTIVKLFTGADCLPSLSVAAAVNLTLLVAQLDPATGWLQVAIQAGSFGLVAFLIVIGLPRFQERLTAERKAERDDFARMLNGINEDRKEERKEFQQEQRETRAYYAKENAELRRMYADSLAAFRTAVHDTRDVANNVAQRANVAVEIAKQAITREKESQ